MQPRRWQTWLRRVVLAAILLAAGLGIWWFWYTHRNYGRLFEMRAGQVLNLERQFVSETNGIRLYDLDILSSSGLRASARIAVPSQLDSIFVGPSQQVPAILLTAGLHTGKEAVNLIPPQTNIIVMAVDYGWSGEFDISTLGNMKRDLGALRATTMEAVPRALLALDALASEPAVNTNQILAVGVSYGSYVSLPAAALHPAVDGLILVQGGGEIGPTIAGNREMWNSPLPAPLAGWIGEIVFAPFDPCRWTHRLGSRDFTMMASRHDDQMPVDALERVYRSATTTGTKQFIWIDTPHVAPDDDEVIAVLASNIVAHINREYAPGGPP